MAKSIYLIGEQKNNQIIQFIADRLKEKEYEPIICPSELLFSRWSYVVNSDLAVFFLSPLSKDDIYKLGSERYNNSKYTLNYFIEPTELDESKKHCIGKNQTVFSNGNLDEESKEIIELLSTSENFLFFNSGNNEADETEESGNSKGKRWLGIIVAACIIGFGIWGYSAYVESVKQEADLAVWNAWEEYLKVTNAGQIFSTLGENIENIDHDSFSERKFNEYIKNNIEPSPDINWGDIGPFVKNIKIEVPPLREITPIMTENLRSLYTKMDDSDYRDQGGWDPIAEMKETNNITITDIVVSTDGKTGKVNYHTSLDASGESPKAIYMLKNDRDLWEISDFKQDGVSFFATVQNFFDEKERNRVVNYEGNVYTSSGTFPITLEINYGVSPITALYHNVEYDVSLEMKGYESDGFLYFSCDNTGETVAFKLERKADEVLIGEFIVTPNDGDVKTYDVVLNKMVFED